MMPNDDRARCTVGRSGDGITGDLVFIHGFQDTAALWQEVIDRLECPGWTPIPVSLHHTGLREPRPRGATLEAYRDQVGEAIDAVDAGVDRLAVVIGHSMGTQVAYHSPAMQEYEAHFPLPPSVEEPSYVTLRSTRKAQMYEPGAWVGRVSPTPLLMVVGMRDTLTPTDLALAAYERALQPKRLAMFDGDHFDSYVAAFETTSAAATDWFCEQLGKQEEQELKR